MAGLTDIKNKLPKMKKPNGYSHSTNVLGVFFALLILLLMILISTSCRPLKEVHHKEATYKEFFKDSTIVINGEVVTAPINEEFLNALQNHFKTNLKDTFVIQSRTGNQELKFYLDALGALQASCESKDREINQLIKVIESFEKSDKEVVLRQNPFNINFWILGIALIILQVLILFKRK
jgi:hypothetical protein